MSDEVLYAYEEKITEGLYLLLSEHNCPVTKGAFINMIVEILSRCDYFRDVTITASLKSLLPTVLQCKGKRIAYKTLCFFLKIIGFLENFGFIITQQKAARLWLQLSYASQDFSLVEQALCDVLNHPLPDVVLEACIFLLTRTESSEDEIDGKSSSLLGLKPSGLKYSAQIKNSSKVAFLLVNRALELTPLVTSLFILIFH